MKRKVIQGAKFGTPDSPKKHLHHLDQKCLK